MNIQQRMGILETLGTKELVKNQEALEKKYEDAIREELAFTDANSRYLSTGDCTAVKQILAELMVNIPAECKNQAQRDAWLVKQRTEHPALKEAISQQEACAYTKEVHKIDIDAVRRRLDGVRGLIALRTAQINFLAGASNE